MPGKHVPSSVNGVASIITTVVTVAHSWHNLFLGGGCSWRWQVLSPLLISQHKNCLSYKIICHSLIVKKQPLG